MTRRLGLATIMSLLALALLMPGTALGAYAPYRSVVLRAVCTNSGGLYGHGKIVLKVEGLSYADADTNYFVFKVRRQEKVNGVWVNVEKTTHTSAVFPDDTEGVFSAVNKSKYVFPTAEHPRTRLLTKIQFWDERAGADVLLAVHGHRTAGC